MGINMYFSVDVETDGEAPGVSSMLSIGAVAIDPVTNEPCGEFYRTLKRLPEARPNNRTMEWWDQHPKQWAETRTNPQDPKEVMQALHDWVIQEGKTIRGIHGMEVGPTPIFVADPGAFDFSFVFYYLHRFVGDSVFGFSAMCLTNYAMALLDTDFRIPGAKKNRPEEWNSPLPHTHNALEDARQQADVMIRMRKWRRARILTLKPEEPVPTE